MKKCQNCGLESNSAGNFCRGCGEKIIVTTDKKEEVKEVIQVNEVEEIKENVEQVGEATSASKSKFDINEIVQKIKTKFNGANIKEIDVKNVDIKNFDFKKNKNLLIIGGVALAIIAGIILVTATNIFAKSENKIIMGVYNLATENEKTGSVKFSMDSKNGYIPEMVNDMDIELFYDYNMKKQENKVKGSLLIKNDPVIELASAMNKDALYIDTLGLYKDYFYVKMDKDYMKSVEEFYKFFEYFKDAELKGVKKSKYIDALGMALKKDIKKEGGKIVINVTPGTIYEIMNSVLAVAKNDEKLADAIYTDIVGMRSEMKKDKVQFESYAFEDVMEILDELPTKKDFKEEFNYLIDELYEDSKDEKQYYNENKEWYSDEKIRIAFDISMLNKIKSIEFTVADEDLKGTMLLNTGKSFKTSNYNVESGVNLEKLMESDKAEDVGYEIISNLSDKILQNDTLIKYLESSEISEELEYEFGTSNIEEIFEMMLDEIRY